MTRGHPARHAPNPSGSGCGRCELLQRGRDRRGPAFKSLGCEPPPIRPDPRRPIDHLTRPPHNFPDARPLQSFAGARRSWGSGSSIRRERRRTCISTSAHGRAPVRHLEPRGDRGQVLNIKSPQILSRQSWTASKLAFALSFPVRTQSSGGGGRKLRPPCQAEVLQVAGLRIQRTLRCPGGRSVGLAQATARLCHGCGRVGQGPQARVAHVAMTSPVMSELRHALGS